MQQVKTQMIDLATDMVGRFIYSRSGMEQTSNISQSIKIRGHRIWYQDAGKGRPVIFLHGLGSNSLSWLMTIPVFSSQYRVIAIDHIGHGRSDKPGIAYRITDFVDYLEDFLSSLNLSNVDLVGNSLGGWIGARLALKRPDLISRLVLVGSAGLEPWPELREKLENTKFAPRTAKEIKTFLSMCFHDKLRYTNQFSVMISYLVRSLDSSHSTIEKVLQSALDPNEWLDGKLHQIKAQTLVLWGQQDELMPLKFAYQFAESIPNTDLKIISDCGHVPQIEKAKEFNQILKDFLK